jgi:hypothetical protein
LFTHGQGRAEEPAAAGDAVTVLTDGPVHEAYAKPAEANPTPTQVIPKRPPEPIKELPPDQQPKGKAVQWIPGYWGWDAAKNDFIWVSGVWRVPPPGRRWVPGYWTEAKGGWQWVPGFWAPAQQEEVPYQATPPRSLENGPSTPAPDDNSVYVPGTWLNQDSSYAWRPGFWTPSYDNWVWNPSYYSWTPAGSVFVNGFWDFPLADRGLLFAPVFFHRPLFTSPDFFFTPSFAVNPFAFNSLFFRPGFSSFFFGDRFFSPFFGNPFFSPFFSSSFFGSPFFPSLFASNFFFNHVFNNIVNNNIVNNNIINNNIVNNNILNNNSALWNHQLLGPDPRGTHGLQAAGRPGNPLGRPAVTPLHQLANTKPGLTTASAATLAQNRKGIQQFRDLSTQRSQFERSNAAAAHAETTGRSGAGLRSAWKLPTQPQTGPLRGGSNSRPSGLAAARDRGSGSATGAAGRPRDGAPTSSARSSFAPSPGSHSGGRADPGFRPSTNGRSFAGQSQQPGFRPTSPYRSPSHSSRSFSSPSFGSRPSFSSGHSAGGAHSFSGGMHSFGGGGHGGGSFGGGGHGGGHHR